MRPRGVLGIDGDDGDTAVNDDHLYGHGGYGAHLTTALRQPSGVREGVGVVAEAVAAHGSDDDSAAQRLFIERSGGAAGVRAVGTAGVQ